MALSQSGRSAAQSPACKHCTQLFDETSQTGVFPWQAPAHPEAPSLLAELALALRQTGARERSDQVLDEAMAAARANGDLRIEYRVQLERALKE